MLLGVSQGNEHSFEQMLALSSSSRLAWLEVGIALPEFL